MAMGAAAGNNKDPTKPLTFFTVGGKG
jgi:hypothetical protein